MIRSSNLPIKAFALLVSLLTIPSLCAQVLNSGGGNSGGGSSQGDNSQSSSVNRGGGSSNNNDGGGGGSDSFLGSDVPVYDDSSDTVMWNGKSWNIMNNSIFEARFEKYLATLDANKEEDLRYRALHDAMLEALSPNRKGGPSLVQAVALLPEAAKHPIDARICDTIANAVYGVWLGHKSVSEQNQFIENMDDARGALAWNIEVSSEPTDFEMDKSKKRTVPSEAKAASLGRTAVYIKKMAEIEAKVKLLQAEIAVSDLRNKVEFQGLIIQLFMQRRFEHVVLACRLYRQLFRDGDSTLHMEEGSDVDKMFSSSMGVNPTINTLDAFANEALRDVTEGVAAFETLLAKNEIDSASKRLGESFMVGEYLHAIRTVPFDSKRQVVAYVRDGNMLRSAMEVRDFALADEIVIRMRESAHDFDFAKPAAAIQTAKTVSKMHLQKAKIAAMQGDGETVSVELTKATEIWPTNPMLGEVGDMISDSGDIKSQTLLDLDRLVAQRNYRQIFNEQGRFAGAVLDDPQRQEQLKEIITDMTRINMEIQGAKRMAADGYHPAAWESIKKAGEEFPDDSEVSKLLSELTTEVPDFVKALQNASKLEERGQIGSAIAWFLKAKSIHPGSSFARDGLRRSVDAATPSGSTSQNSSSSSLEPETSSL